MAPLTFAGTHNMVAFLTKSVASAGFDQIVDFLNAHVIQVKCLPTEEIFVELARMVQRELRGTNSVVQWRMLSSALLQGENSTSLRGCIQTGGEIAEIDANEEITLVYMKTSVDLGTELQGRTDSDNAASKDVNFAEPTMFDDEKATMTMAQTLIKMKDKKARLPDEHMAKRLHDKEITKAAAKEKQEKDDLKYQDLKKKRVSVAQARKNMIIYLKNMAGYKMKHFRAKVEEAVEVPIAPTPPSPTNEPSPPPQDPIPTPSQAQPATPSSSPHEQPTDTSDSSMTLLNTLMATCATLSQKVAQLEQDKITQALKILKLKKRVKKLEKKRRSKSSGLKRLRKGEIAKIDANEEITLVYMETSIDLGTELQGRTDGDNAASKDVNVAEPTMFDDEEATMTMAQTLIKMKDKKSKTP
nr:hypothetical protein [Tanacetum cinerariifolium]